MKVPNIKCMLLNIRINSTVVWSKGLVNATIKVHFSDKEVLIE